MRYLAPRPFTLPAAPPAAHPPPALRALRSAAPGAGRDGIVRYIIRICDTAQGPGWGGGGASRGLGVAEEVEVGEDAGDGVGAVEHIKVDARGAVVPQILRLAGGVLYADAADGAVVVGVAFQLGI